MDFGVRMLDRKDLNWCTPIFAVSQCTILPVCNDSGVGIQPEAFGKFAVDMVLTVLLLRSL